MRQCRRETHLPVELAASAGDGSAAFVTDSSRAARARMPGLLRPANDLQVRLDDGRRGTAPKGLTRCLRDHPLQTGEGRETFSRYETVETS